MRRLACVSFAAVSSRTYTKRLWSSAASQLPDTPAQLAAQQGPQGRPIRIPDLCGDLVDAGVSGAQEMDGMLHAQVLEIRQWCLAQNALQPPRQGALACARGAGRLRQREPLREPTSGPALEALHHWVGMRKVVVNHELGLRTACLDQQIACHQGRQRRTAPRMMCKAKSTWAKAAPAVVKRVEFTIMRDSSNVTFG